MGVEKDLRIQDESGVFGEVLELKNGCICCSVRSNFLVAVDTLLEMRDFDYVIVECSGIADPGKLLSLFWVDDQLESRVYLDGILTIVDASLLTSYLHHHHSFSKLVISQIAYADRLVLNKSDKVDEAYLLKSKSILASLNANAPILISTHSKVPIEQVLNIKSLRLGKQLEASVNNAFNLFKSTNDLHEQTYCHHHECASELCEDAMHFHDSASSSADIITVSSSSIEPDYIINGVNVYITKHAQNSKADDETFNFDHSISTQVFSVVTPSLNQDPNTGIVLQKLKMWLNQLLYEEGEEIYDMDINTKYELHKTSIFRMKAVLAVIGESRKYYLQSVQDVYDLSTADSNDKIDKVPSNDHSLTNSLQYDMFDSNLPRESRLIVIGLNLDYKGIAEGFAQCFQF